MFAAAGSEVGQVGSETSQVAGAAERLGELLAERPAITAPAVARELPSPTAGSLRFDRIGFAYPTHKERRVLDGLSLDVAPGETVAIVGLSGAGKSTLFHLLLRFYDPDEGTLSLDGVPIAEVAPGALRRRIATVPQEAGVRRHRARQHPLSPRRHRRRGGGRGAAGAGGRPSARPLGYETPIGERGVTLSGGQRQRIAIARAILKDAPVLLLDEATSALDAESEKLVQSALGRLMRGRTTLVIAHRLATVLAADRIVVLEGGRVVEEGPHRALAEQGGVYAKLALLQFTSA